MAKPLSQDLRGRVVAAVKAAHAAEQDRPDGVRRRQGWFGVQPELDPERLVFIDKTAANTKLARLRGRVPQGQRGRAAVPAARAGPALATRR